MSAQISELVTLAKNGSAEAFGELYEIYYKDMYCYACYVTGSESLAQDAVSDAVLSAFQQIRSLRKPAALKTGDLTSRACSTISTSLSSFATPCRRLRPMRGR